MLIKNILGNKLRNLFWLTFDSKNLLFKLRKTLDD